MVHIELTGRDAAMLREALLIYCAGLRKEIAHTDARDFRRGLMERLELLEAVVSRLELAATVAAAGA